MRFKEGLSIEMIAKKIHVSSYRIKKSIFYLCNEVKFNELKNNLANKCSLYQFNL